MIRLWPCRHKFLIKGCSQTTVCNKLEQVPVTTYTGLSAEMNPPATAASHRSALWLWA